MATETWKAVAIALGKQMASHGAGCDEETLDLDPASGPRIVKAHPNPADFPDCPQCADRVAYLRFLDKMFTERARDEGRRRRRNRTTILMVPRG